MTATATPTQTFRTLAAASRDLRDADLLLFRRPRGLIAVGGRTRYSHAAMVARWGGDWMLLEATGWGGQRATALANQVARYPGRIDVFSADPDDRYADTFRRECAVEYFRERTGRGYGWAGLARCAAMHLPGVRFFVRPTLDDEQAGNWRQFCSHLYAAAIRVGGGVDPVCELEDRSTEPGDLARSPFFRYLCTLSRPGTPDTTPPDWARKTTITRDDLVADRLAIWDDWAGKTTIADLDRLADLREFNHAREEISREMESLAAELGVSPETLAGMTIAEVIDQYERPDE